MKRWGTKLFSDGNSFDFILKSSGLIGIQEEQAFCGPLVEHPYMSEPNITHCNLSTLI